jgi:tripartite-type tricarboxylate transporter receptor subunit TctC
MKLVHGAIGVAMALSCAAASAQTPKFPSKPLRMLVGFAPGGATDIIARFISPGLTDGLGQSVVVENRPGASSLIAGELVAKSPPDGHTLMMVTQTLINAQIMENRAFPVLAKDFSAVSLCATTPLVLVVNPSLPVKSLKELLALAKARPGELNYGSGGLGTSPHMSMELVVKMAGLKLVHVPYKGEAPALVDVMAGHIPMMFSNPAAVMTQVQAGKVRAIAVTALERTPAVPGVPTLAESGLPGFEVLGWFGVVAPVAVPRDVLTRLNAEIAKVLARPDIKEKFASQALEPGNKTAEQYGEFIKSETVKWGDLIREIGLVQQ